jgi:hypothetical protein
MHVRIARVSEYMHCKVSDFCNLSKVYVHPYRVFSVRCTPCCNASNVRQYNIIIRKCSRPRPRRSCARCCSVCTTGPGQVYTVCAETTVTSFTQTFINRCCARWGRLEFWTRFAERRGLHVDVCVYRTLHASHTAVRVLVSAQRTRRARPAVDALESGVAGAVCHNSSCYIRLVAVGRACGTGRRAVGVLVLSGHAGNARAA